MRAKVSYPRSDSLRSTADRSVGRLRWYVYALCLLVALALTFLEKR